MTMRLDVPTIPIVLDADHKADGRPSVGSSIDARFVAPRAAPQVAVTAWGARTVWGDLGTTWDRLLRGHSVDDHIRLPGLGSRGRASALARSVASDVVRRGLDADAAVIVGTSKGSIEDWFSPPPAGPTSDNRAGAAGAYGLGDVAGALAREYRTAGPVLTLSAACASGLHALVWGAMMIRSGQVRQALVVAVEASVHPLFLGSFHRLGVLAKPGAGCRPFDRNRKGFYMTEAAAAVLLEASDDPAGTSTTPHVDRFALGGDATHLTGADPAARVLKHLFHKVIDGRPVDLVHAHGTGTEMNDAAELAAIDAAVGDSPQRPVVYSHKGSLGHSLGASAMLSVVLNCQAHKTDVIPPNVRTTEPLRADRVTIPSTVTRRRVRRSLAVAAGFGGPTAVVSLRSA